MRCRHCNSALQHEVIDLGFSPPSNNLISYSALKEPETHFPLKVSICSQCWLAQVAHDLPSDFLFNTDYVYFSSFSKSWLKHAKIFVDEASKRFELNKSSLVTEIASNDGYLLQFFKEKQIPCYGVEPTQSTANEAKKKGIEVIENFFSENLANEILITKGKSDLIISNNVLAHVPNINDFLKGIYWLLNDNGVATFEFPSLVNLLKYNQFDTIYHEHFSYLSFFSVINIFKKNRLEIFDVDKINTHGGSYRIFSQIEGKGINRITLNVESTLNEEIKFGINKLETYLRFQNDSYKIKNNLLSFLIEAKNKDKIVIAYGAAAKGNTFANFAGIKKDLIRYVVDKNPAKQGKYTPGNHIPIVEEARIKFDKPDYIIIFPWNLFDEIKDQLSYVKEWGGSYVRAIPELHIE